MKKKHKTYVLLESLDIKIPKGNLISNLEDATKLIQTISTPFFVVKPIDQRAGIGIRIVDKTSLKNLLPEYIKKWKKCILQEYFEGPEYRVLVIKKEIVALLEKAYLEVKGNGINTMQELLLIEAKEEHKSSSVEDIMRYIDKVYTYYSITEFTILEINKIYSMKIFKNPDLGRSWNIVYPNKVYIPVLNELQIIVSKINIPYYGMDILFDRDIVLEGNFDYRVLELNGGPALHFWASQIPDFAKILVKKLYF